VFFVNDHNEGHAHVDQLKASSFGGTHPGRVAASKHAFRDQTTTTQQRAPVSSMSSPGSVRSTIPFRSTGRVNQPGNFKIDGTDYDENLAN
jgi:hypothetical protein